MRSFSPAKVNFTLKILGKRPDGFHELETLMAPLTLGDDLEITAGGKPGVRITCEAPGIPLGPENLVWKALAAFAQATDTPLAYEVSLEKRVPAGAGLGGGSSNAASALLAANALHGQPLPPERLREIAGSIGSDVAFFCGSSWALCHGRGELVETIAPPGHFELLLIKPPFGISTPWAYKNWASSRPLPGVSLEAQKVGALEISNDLERPVFQKYLILARLKTWLKARADVQGALMSGSGATVFAILQPGLESAAKGGLRKALEHEFGTTFWVSFASTTG